MAKQRGIHQIKGKINNLCYYEQKYVRGGLIRRINEAMSERLKTDPAFERTRIANTIFGGCSIYASSLLSFFGSRNSFLFRPSRHAILTKLIFEYCTRKDALAGFVNISLLIPFTGTFPYLLDGIIKNPLSVDFSIIPRAIYGLSLGDSYSLTLPADVLTNYLVKYNVESVQVLLSPAHYIYDAGYNAETKKYNYPDMNPGGRGSSYIWSPGEGDLELELRTGDIDDAFLFWIIYILPVVETRGTRAITKQTGATCGLIQFIIS